MRQRGWQRGRSRSQRGGNGGVSQTSSTPKHRFWPVFSLELQKKCCAVCCEVLTYFPAAKGGWAERTGIRRLRGGSARALEGGDPRENTTGPTRRGCRQRNRRRARCRVRRRPRRLRGRWKQPKPQGTGGPGRRKRRTGRETGNRPSHMAAPKRSFPTRQRDGAPARVVCCPPGAFSCPSISGCPDRRAAVRNRRAGRCRRRACAAGSSPRT